MNADQLLVRCREHRPDLRYAMARDGSAVGAWDEAQGRFVAVAMRTITKEWVRCDYELFINGQPPYQPGDWSE